LGDVAAAASNAAAGSVSEAEGPAALDLSRSFDDALPALDHHGGLAPPGGEELNGHALGHGPGAETLEAPRPCRRRRARRRLGSRGGCGTGPATGGAGASRLWLF